MGNTGETSGTENTDKRGFVSITKKLKEKFDIWK
jgi:hypothetical protein